MQVVWTQRAFRNLDDIQDFIAKESPRAAESLVNEIFDRSETLLSDNPLIGPPGRVEETRELVLSNTPYFVVYRARLESEILAVLHSSRDWPESFS